MERKRVRIYKAPDGQGEYRSKLKSFVTAQKGISVDDSAMHRTPDEALKENAITTYVKYVNTQLKDGMSIQGIYKDLLEKGLAEEEAAGLLKYFVQNNLEGTPEASEEKQQQEGQSAEQPTMQEGGAAEQILSQYDAEKGASLEDDETIDLMKLLKEPAENYLSEMQNSSKVYFPGISDYIFDYKPIEFMDPTHSNVYPGLQQAKKGGVSKKSFVKNVLGRFKEGGEDEPAQQGDKMDTMTSEISNRKNSFIAKLKEINEEEKIKNLYDQMMETNDPGLMQTAQTLAGGNGGVGEDNEESLSYQQSGGYLGEGQPELFMNGGVDYPYELEQAQEGKEKRKTKVKYVDNPTLPSSKLRLFNPVWGERKVYSNRPYNALTRELYRDPVDDLTPVARTVHKRGIFGRPKKWTDYYSKDGKLMVPPGATDITTKKDEKKLINDQSEELWDDLSGKAKRAIRRGERRLNRRKGYEDEKELTIQELIALQEEQRKKENDKSYKERKDAIEADDKRKKDFGRIDDPERKKADWETINDRINGKLEEYTEAQLEKFDKESEKPKKPGLLEAIKAESDKMYSQQLANQMGYGVNYQNILDRPTNPNNPNEQRANLEEDILNREINAAENAGYDLYGDLNTYIPADERNTVSPGTYQFTPGKSKTRAAEEARIAAEMEREREAEEWERDMQRNTRKQLGGLPKAQIGVKSPTNGVNPASDPTANKQNWSGVLNMNNQPKKEEFQFPMKMEAPAEEKSALPDWLNKDTWMNSLTEDKDETTEENPDLIAQDFESKRDFNGEAFNQKLNAGIDAFTGLAKRMDTNRQMADYYANNSGVDSFMNPQEAKLKGKFVAYGQESGLIDPTKMGNEKNSIFAGTNSARSGGYMQDGGQSREEILKQFTGTPEFKRGLDLMMQRDNTDNGDPFYDAMREANYTEEDQNKYREAIGEMNNPEWLERVPQKSPYIKSGRQRELQDLMNKAYGSERYNTPYAVGSGGPRREDERYIPTPERRPTPFEDGRVDPRTLEAIQPGANEYEGMQIGGYMEEEGYAEGGVFDMDEDELREFLANGGEVEYLES